MSPAAFSGRNPVFFAFGCAALPRRGRRSAPSLPNENTARPSHPDNRQ